VLLTVKADVSYLPLGLKVLTVTPKEVKGTKEVRSEAFAATVFNKISGDQPRQMNKRNDYSSDAADRPRRFYWNQGRPLKRLECVRPDKSTSGLTPS
jgi:hypothetical protein